MRKPSLIFLTSLWVTLPTCFAMDSVVDAHTHSLQKITAALNTPTDPCPNGSLPSNSSQAVAMIQGKLELEDMAPGTAKAGMIKARASIKKFCQILDPHESLIGSACTLYEDAITSHQNTDGARQLLFDKIRKSNRAADTLVKIVQAELTDQRTKCLASAMPKSSLGQWGEKTQIPAATNNLKTKKMVLHSSESPIDSPESQGSSAGNAQ